MNSKTQQWFMPWRWNWQSWAIAIIVALIVLLASFTSLVVLQQRMIQDRHRRQQIEREQVREDLRRFGKSLHEASPGQPDQPADARDSQPDAN